MANESTLVRIRERSFLDVLDLAIVVVRNRSWPLILASTAGIAPCLLLNYWIAATMTGPRFLWIPILYMEAPWATAPLTLVIGGLMFRRSPGPGSIARHLLQALPTLVIAQLIVRGLFCFSIVLMPLIPSRLAFLNEVILLERCRGFKAIGRCWRLTGNRSGEFFLQWLGQIGFGVVFCGCFWMGTGAALSALVKSELTWDRPALADLGGWRLQLGLWLAIAFFGLVRFLSYINQRIRVEGWELRLRLQSAVRSLDEHGP